MKIRMLLSAVLAAGTLLTATAYAHDRDDYRRHDGRGHYYYRGDSGYERDHWRHDYRSDHRPWEYRQHYYGGGYYYQRPYLYWPHYYYPCQSYYEYGYPYGYSSGGYSSGFNDSLTVTVALY